MTEPMESREDILISRVIDGTARADDLREIASLAAGDASLWDRLASADSDRAALTLALASAIVVADAVEAPMHAYAEQKESHGRYRFIGASGWVGWSAAAAVVFAWTISSRGPVPGPIGGPSTEVRSVSLSADDALAKYIEASKAEDRFIRELPKVMVESHRASDGSGTEVTYLRQFIERVTVNNLYELSTDEHGRPGAVRVNSPIGTPSVLY